MKTVIAVLLGVLPLVAAADQTIYRCIGAQGMSYQDYPCEGARPTQNRVLVTGELASSRPARVTASDRSLARWAEQTGRENRLREAETHVRAKERENAQTEAEFAAMIEELDQQQQDSYAGIADLPPPAQVEAQKAQVRQTYAEKLQQSDAELRLAREAAAAQR